MVRRPRRLVAALALALTALGAPAGAALLASPAQAAVTGIVINEIDSDATPDWVEITAAEASGTK